MERRFFVGKKRNKELTPEEIVIQPNMNHQNGPARKYSKAECDNGYTYYEQDKPCKYNQNPNARTRNAKDDDERDKRGLKTSIPKAIYDGLSPFFNAQELYKKYGILLRAKSEYDSKKEIYFEDHGNEYIDEFYNVLRHYKLGKIKSIYEETPRYYTLTPLPINFVSKFRAPANCNVNVSSVGK